MPRFSEVKKKTMTRILTITLALIFALGPSNLAIGAPRKRSSITR